MMWFHGVSYGLIWFDVVQYRLTRFGVLCESAQWQDAGSRGVPLRDQYLG